MGALAQQVAAIVHRNSPNVLCLTCLAAQHGLPEHDVRAVALVLITRADLQLVRRVCSSCQRAEELLAVPKAA
jgi:hypothetical protein